MRIVYIAGPYRAPTERGIVENIRRAEQVAIEVWKLGAAALCPHTNSALMGGVVPDEAFLNGGLALLEKCDAVMLVDPWHGSEGTLAEINHATDCGIPVFEHLEMLREWVESVD